MDPSSYSSDQMSVDTGIAIRWVSACRTIDSAVNCVTNAMRDDCALPIAWSCRPGTPLLKPSLRAWISHWHGFFRWRRAAVWTTPGMYSLIRWSRSSRPVLRTKQSLRLQTVGSTS